MSKVVIKTVNRKTTISKAVINKAAKTAYRTMAASALSQPQKKKTKPSKAA